MFERWALVIVSLGKSFLWSREEKKWPMCCIRKLLEAFCVGCKLMVDQFKIKGVKVMENKTRCSHPEKRANSQWHLILILSLTFQVHICHTSHAEAVFHKH